MKRYLLMLLMISLCFCRLPVWASEPIKENVPELSDEELLDLYDMIYDELVKRGLKDDTSLNLPEGKYVVGTDVPPGKYMITCTSTNGEEIESLYSSLGNMLDSLDAEGSGYGESWSSLGGAMGALAETNIRILGDYGDVLRSYTLKKDESVQVSLAENTALKIENGSCTLSLLE